MQDIRKSSAYKRWRREVRQRDGDACRVCGVHLNLHIHHIKPLEKYRDFATEIDNGITLCGNCHALLRGKEESTNLQTIIEAATKKPDMRTTDQLKRLSSKFCTYLEPRVKSIHSNLRNKAIQQLFVQLQIYPDSLDQFLPLIRYLLDKSHLLDKENSGFNPRFIVQMAVEYLEGSSSSAALKVLREYEKQIEAEKEERSELFPRARQGDAEAQFRLGEMWATGKGGDRSSSAAFDYYRAAAQQGHAKAQFRVGNMYESGTGVSDSSEAAKWRHQATEQGHAEAQYTLAQMCDDSGHDREAFRWYHQAAKQGHAEAQYRLGEIYEGKDSDVRYFIEDYWDCSEVYKAEALYWYIEAAEQGHAEAQYKLGEMYEDIEICLRDYSESEDYKAEAIKWYRKAAEQGYAQAEHQMSARDRRELAIMQSNKSHPLNKAAADQLGKIGALPPSCLYALVLIQYGIDQQARKAEVESNLMLAVREQVDALDEWTPKRTMRFLTHYLEDDEPTQAANLVHQAGTPLDAAQELIEIVRVNLIATGIEIVPDRPWAQITIVGNQSCSKQK